MFNPGGTKVANENVPPATDVFGAMPTVSNQVNYFVPAPVSDVNAPVDFLTPSAMASEESSQVS